MAGRIESRLVRQFGDLYLPSEYRSPGSASARWYRYANPAGLAFNIWLNRRLLWQYTKREVQARYRGSALGLFWSLLVPLGMLLTYTLVFAGIFRARWPGSTGGSADFALALLAGLIVFTAFSECLLRAPALVVANPNYVKRVRFPLEILPFTVLGAALFHAALSTGVLLAGIVFIRGGLPPIALLAPVAFVPLIALTLGVCWIVGALAVYVRDVAYAVTIAVQILMFLTPVFYPLSLVPEPLRTFIAANPLSVVVETFRRPLVDGVMPDLLAWTVVTTGSVLIALLGYAWFMKTRPGFADVL